MQKYAWWISEWFKPDPAVHKLSETISVLHRHGGRSMYVCMEGSMQSSNLLCKLHFALAAPSASADATTSLLKI